MIKCELWLGEPQKKIGDHEFISVPRIGEAVSVRVDTDANYTTYRVDDITHRAQSNEDSPATYVFVSRAA